MKSGLDKKYCNFLWLLIIIIIRVEKDNNCICRVEDNCHLILIVGQENIIEVFQFYQSTMSSETPNLHLWKLLAKLTHCPSNDSETHHFALFGWLKTYERTKCLALFIFCQLPNMPPTLLSVFCFCLSTYAIPIDNGVVGEPSVQCDTAQIRVDFSVRNAFQGRIFAKGASKEPNCVVRGRGEISPSFAIGTTLQDCGVRRLREVSFLLDLYSYSFRKLERKRKFKKGLLDFVNQNGIESFFCNENETGIEIHSQL